MNDLRAAETENLIPRRYFFGRNYTQQNSLYPDPRSSEHPRSLLMKEEAARWSTLESLLRREQWSGRA